MSEAKWIAKNEVASLLGVSPKTIQRRLSGLEPHYVRREGRTVLVAAEAVQEGLLGSRVGELDEKVDLLERTVTTLSQHSEEQQRQIELERLQLLVDTQAGEIASLQKQLAVANRAVEALHLMTAPTETTTR